MAVSAFPTPPKKSRFPIVPVIGVVILIGALAFWFYKYQSGSSPDTTPPPANSAAQSSGTSAPAISPEDQAKVTEILQTIGVLNSLNLDTKFFEDPRFTSLTETPFSIPDITPVNVPHPFVFFSPESAPAGSAPAPVTTKKK
jgi:hypothetical protein